MRSREKSLRRVNPPRRAPPTRCVVAGRGHPRGPARVRQNESTTVAPGVIRAQRTSARRPPAPRRPGAAGRSGRRPELEHRRAGGLVVEPQHAGRAGSPSSVPRSRVPWRPAARPAAATRPRPCPVARATAPGRAARRTGATPGTGRRRRRRGCPSCRVHVQRVQRQHAGGPGEQPGPVGAAIVIVAAGANPPPARPPARPGDRTGELRSSSSSGAGAGGGSPASTARHASTSSVTRDAFQWSTRPARWPCCPTR